MRHRKYENRRGGGRLGRHKKITKFAEQRTPLAKDFEGRNEAPKKDDEDLIVPATEATEDVKATEAVEEGTGMTKTEGKKLTNREKHALMKQKADLRRQKMGKPVAEKSGKKKRIQSDEEETGKRKRSEFGPDYDEDGVPSLLKPLVLPKIPRLEEALAKMAAMQKESVDEKEENAADGEDVSDDDDEDPKTDKPAFGEVIEAPPVFSKKAASVGVKAAKHSQEAAIRNAVSEGVTGWRRQVKGKSLESLMKSVEANVVRLVKAEAPAPVLQWVYKLFSSMATAALGKGRRPCVPAGDDPPYYKKVVPYLPRWPHSHFKVHLTKGMSYMKGNGNEVVFDDRSALPRQTVADQVEGIFRCSKEDTKQVILGDAGDFDTVESAEDSNAQAVFDKDVFECCEFAAEPSRRVRPERILQFNFRTWMKMKLGKAAFNRRCLPDACPADAEILLEIITTSTPPAMTKSRRPGILPRTQSVPELDIAPVQRLPWRSTVLQSTFRRRTGRPGAWTQLRYDNQVYSLSLAGFLSLFPRTFLLFWPSQDALTKLDIDYPFVKARFVNSFRGLSAMSSMSSSPFGSGPASLDNKAAFAANLFYSALLGVGGVVGYMQAGSKVSIIAGTLSCLAVGVITLSTRVLPQRRRGLRKVQLVLVSFLTLFFVKRLQQTSKFMPGGLMAVLGVVVVGVTAATIKAGKNDSPEKKE
ncbi:hypothetical protein FOZ63_027417 [Perkinsus olseni]|uniref:Uncharacterized protein n=1 Tax=Perkinsus olseni TaxID=32597 RepID=A0A7J6SWB0_PEROL|nr:hypothetical protein FOZ63_027417 [Perkinsus olseni]